jgi:hypothetical protein
MFGDICVANMLFVVKDMVMGFVDLLHAACKFRDEQKARSWSTAGLKRVDVPLCPCALEVLFLQNKLIQFSFAVSHQIFLCGCAMLSRAIPSPGAYFGKLQQRNERQVTFCR